MMPALGVFFEHLLIDYLTPSRGMVVPLDAYQYS